jgi:nucleolar protein 58
LKNFQKFDSAATALEEVAAVVEGKVTPRLANLLDSIKDEKKVSLAVADPKLGTMALLSLLTAFLFRLILTFYS